MSLQRWGDQFGQTAEVVLAVDGQSAAIYSDIFNNKIVSGLWQDTPPASLTMTTPGGVAYVSGKRLVLENSDPVLTYTYPANKIIWEDLKSDGTITRTVTNAGDPVPAIPADHARFQKVTTGAAQVDATERTGVLDNDLAMGVGALVNQSVEGANVAFGLNVMTNSTEGASNVGIGHDALYSLTSGSLNIAVGYAAMTSLTTGGSNAGFGDEPLSRLISGSNNVGIGNAPLPELQAGDRNIGIGQQSGRGTGGVGTGITNASDTISIGFQSGQSPSSNFNNTIAIGSYAIATKANQVVLGGPSVIEWAPGSNGRVNLGSETSSFKSLHVDFTDTATVGAVTINKSAGRVNVAAGGTSVVVTNSLVKATSKIFATVASNDATAYIKNVVPAAGSFTINLGAATTAQTAIDFFVVNPV
jgi:hypothetical protein